MRQVWTIMVIVSFISVLSGSFIAMAYSGENTYICLASRLNGSEAPCPESDPIGFANFHGSALRAFSNLIVADGSALLFVLALLSIVLCGLLSDKLSEINSLKLIVVSSPDSKSKNYPLTAGRLSWFSLHENSPSYFRAAN